LFVQGVWTETDIDLAGIKEHHSFGAVSVKLLMEGLVLNHEPSE